MTRTERVVNEYTVGPYTFQEIENHGFSDPDPLWRFCINGVQSRELYPNLDYVMAAAIAEVHIGPRGAGGTGVGTAADWFMKMIGAPTE